MENKFKVVHEVIFPSIMRGKVCSGVIRYVRVQQDVMTFLRSLGTKFAVVS